ncbi:shikimate dehydrogenase [Alkalicella caledoniensis]|uniref:Shikimate dehydrogenase n=1 Tax=Alkalicella caledoniensis TaxID=2731377 RepID=A0A7G9W822_ALKCA|nr:shikimate dehydrogenase [Alkalicella caledoniensis]QNO14834.1 shikimate dehydrogenase [Alkalicella caledoniensis]
MDKDFAFIIHPISLQDMYRKFPVLQKVPKSMLNGLIKNLPAIKVSEINGVESGYNKTSGYFVGCTLTSEQMVNLPEKFVLKKIIQSGKLAQKLGAKIVGLGAMTSVVGDAGITVAKNLSIPVTTGNSYTVASALEGTQKAATIMGHDFENAEITIIGATGSIGGLVSRSLATKAKNINLVARNEERLHNLAEKIYFETKNSVRISDDFKKTLRKSDILISVSGSVDHLIEPDDLKPGAIVCDVARPRDVSKQVQEKRDDVLVIEGGVIEVPGDVNFNFNFGFPQKTAYACMAETMILSLEKKYENFTLGRDLSIEQLDEISSLAAKHGFKLAGFRSFERALTEKEILKIKDNATLNSLNLEKCAVRV